MHVLAVSAQIERIQTESTSPIDALNSLQHIIAQGDGLSFDYSTSLYCQLNCMFLQL